MFYIVGCAYVITHKNKKRKEDENGNNNVTINIYKNGQVAHSWAKAYKTPEKGLKLRKEAEEVLKEFGFTPVIR